VIVAAVALLLVVTGLVIALIALGRFKRRVQATMAHLNGVFDRERAAGIAAQLQSSIDEVAPLLVRANAALARINRALSELRLPQAVVALRTAGAAIRLLTSGR